MQNTGHTLTERGQRVPTTRVAPVLQDLMVYLADGVQRAELPEAMGVKQSSIHTYLRRLYVHFQCHTFAELWTIAQDDGWSSMAMRHELETI